VNTLMKRKRGRARTLQRNRLLKTSDHLGWHKGQWESRGGGLQEDIRSIRLRNGNRKWLLKKGEGERPGEK